MSRLLRRAALLFSLAAFATAPGCIVDPPADAPDSDGGTGGIRPPDDVESPDGLALTFVSGHLGNYWDCPEEAATASDAASPDPGAEADRGACPPELNDQCEPFLNCEAAMVLVEVRNTTDTAVSAFTVRSLALVDEAGEVVAAEPLGVFEPMTDSAPAALAPGEMRQLRVDFRGPAREAAARFNDPDHPVHVELELLGDDRTDGHLSTPPLWSLPAVAT